MDENGVAILTDHQIEDIIKRSYQYVALYNVNHKMVLAEESKATGGYNKGLKHTDLPDHTVKFIDRPNNDVLYQQVMLDLSKDAIVFEIPSIESKYLPLMTIGYDGDKIEGIDEIFETTGDFVSVKLRVMPHANEPERDKRMIELVNAINGMPLSEYQGKPAMEPDEVNLPPYGKTDADIFENNLLEAMQFVFNTLPSTRISNCTIRYWLSMYP